MNQLLEKENCKIENLIYEIRGKQVMLDSDLANIFCVTTSNLNRAMKRNINRFPEEFCFQLSNKEFENLRCQIGISSLEYGGRRYISTNLIEQIIINDLVFDNRKRIEMLEKNFSKYSIAQKNIFFQGQIYDAYSLL